MSQKLVGQLVTTNDRTSFRLPDRVSQASDCNTKTSIMVIRSSPSFSNRMVDDVIDWNPALARNMAKIERES